MEQVREKVIAHWAEMSPFWAITRSTAKVHAFLLTSERPLNADEIGAKLGLSRGNVSMALRDLMRWGVIRKVHMSQERKEHFEVQADMWKALLQIIKERRRREYEPTLEILHECREDLRILKQKGKKDPAAEAVDTRLAKLEKFYERLSMLMDQFIAAGTFFSRKNVRRAEPWQRLWS